MRRERIDVLIVDESDTSSRLISKAVRRAAPLASLVRVKDSGQALRLMLQQGLFTQRPQLPRLVLLDLDLPGEAARVMLERLGEDAEARAVPIIVLMGADSGSAVAESHARGARVCLIKPHDPTAYMSAVSSAVGVYLGNVPS